MRGRDDQKLWMTGEDRGRNLGEGREKKGVAGVGEERQGRRGGSRDVGGQG